MQLWDIAGQERYSNMTRVYYRAADGAFVVFDCTRPRTFEQVTKWKQDIDQKVLDASDNPVAVVLLMVTSRSFPFVCKLVSCLVVFVTRVDFAPSNRTSATSQKTRPSPPAKNCIAL